MCQICISRLRRGLSRSKLGHQRKVRTMSEFERALESRAQSGAMRRTQRKHECGIFCVSESSTEQISNWPAHQSIVLTAFKIAKDR